jgi:broad specificity phosphatase PhoE
VRIVLARHGETEWSRSGRHTSTTDVPLTEAGRAAALALAPLLEDRSFALVLSSPRIRARDTCALAGLECELDPDLVEWDYGDYEGLTSKQIKAREPGWFLWTEGAPGGETPEQVAGRADRVLARALAAGGDVALFAHGHILRAIGARWLELPVARGGSLALDTASRSELGFEHGDDRVIWLWNDTSHLHAGG